MFGWALPSILYFKLLLSVPALFTSQQTRTWIPRVGMSTSVHWCSAWCLWGAYRTHRSHSNARILDQAHLSWNTVVFDWRRKCHNCLRASLSGPVVYYMVGGGLSGWAGWGNLGPSFSLWAKRDRCGGSQPCPVMLTCTLSYLFC
jgi:hypothetical protein